MIETILYEFLSGALTVPVFLEQRNTPKEFVLIDHTGGNTTNHLKRATIAIQAYGESLYKAAYLMDQVVNAMMYEAIKEDKIASVELNSGPYNYTRQETKQYRYQSVFEVFYY